MLWRQMFNKHHALSKNVQPASCFGDKHWDDLRFADSNAADADADADANDAGELSTSDVKQWIQGWDNRWLQ